MSEARRPARETETRSHQTDPPYGVDYAAKNAYLNRADRGNRIQVPIENDKLTAGETGLLLKAALSLAKSWAQAGASLYATPPERFTQVSWARKVNLAAVNA